jgi:hypothetical protein
MRRCKYDDTRWRRWVEAKRIYIAHVDKILSDLDVPYVLDELYPMADERAS